MCVGCFVVSAFTLFMPPTEAPIPAGLSVDVPPSTMGQMQAIASPAANKQELEELRIAMGKMVDSFPSNPEGEALKDKFAELNDQLQGAESLEAANNILDEGFEVIKEKIIASPNSDDLIDLMYQIREAQFERLQAFSPILPGLKTGWLS